MKNCFLCKPFMRDLGLFLLRVAVAVIFISHGWDKLNDIQGTASFFGGSGIPMPEFMAYLVGLVELLGGIGVLLGVYTKIWASLLAVVMVVALLSVHLSAPATGQLALALLGGNLALVGVGAGKWSLWKDCFCCD